MSLCSYRPLDVRQQAYANGIKATVTVIAFTLFVFSLGMSYQRSHTELVKYCSADGEACWQEIDFTNEF